MIRTATHWSTFDLFGIATLCVIIVALCVLCVVTFPRRSDHGENNDQ